METYGRKGMPAGMGRGRSKAVVWVWGWLGGPHGELWNQRGPRRCPEQDFYRSSHGVQVAWEGTWLWLKGLSTESRLTANSAPSSWDKSLLVGEDVWHLHSVHLWHLCIHVVMDVLRAAPLGPRALFFLQETRKRKVDGATAPDAAAGLRTTSS